jgi:hypothetical protein
MRTVRRQVACVALVAAAALAGCESGGNSETKKRQEDNSGIGNVCQDVGRDCGNKVVVLPSEKCEAGTLSAAPEFRQQTTTVDKISHSEEGGQYRITAAGYSVTGYMIPIRNLDCPYQVRVTATLLAGLKTEPGWGWGYGLGACNSWTGQRAQGFSLQYAFFNDNGTIQPNHSLNAYPDVNDLHADPGEINSSGSTHVWNITVRDGKVWINEDAAPPLGPFAGVGNKSAKYAYEQALPKTCTNKGVFLRVFNADVIFTDIAAEGLST